MFRILSDAFMVGTVTRWPALIDPQRVQFWSPLVLVGLCLTISLTRPVRVRSDFGTSDFTSWAANPCFYVVHSEFKNIALIGVIAHRMRKGVLLVKACSFTASLTSQVHLQTRRCVKSAAFNVVLVRRFQGLPCVVQTNAGWFTCRCCRLGGAALRLKPVALSSRQIPWKLARIWLGEKLSKMLVRYRC